MDVSVSCFSAGFSLTRHFSFTADGPSYVTFNSPRLQREMFKSSDAANYSTPFQ